MCSVRYSCQILTKLELFRQIVEKYVNIKFYGNPSSWEPSCSMWTDGLTGGQTDMTKVIVPFRNSTKADKNVAVLRKENN